MAVVRTLNSATEMKSTPDAHDPDWPKYPETVLTFATQPPIEIDLRAIPPRVALTSLARAGLGKPFAIMTAFDPRGEHLRSEQNEHRGPVIAGHRGKPA